MNEPSASIFPLDRGCGCGGIRDRRHSAPLSVPGGRCRSCQRENCEVCWPAAGPARRRGLLALLRVDDLSGPEIRALLEEHLTNMAQLSPPGSVHALDIDALRQPDVTFWSAWAGTDLLGCGALKQLDPFHGEVKSMRTAMAFRGQGVARRLLGHIVDEARSRGYTALSLETGSMAAFEPARKLYESFGFVYGAPFADYVDDPHSVFMRRVP
jgi:putative acetyltransferase